MGHRFTQIFIQKSGHEVRDRRSEVRRQRTEDRQQKTILLGTRHFSISDLGLHPPASPERAGSRWRAGISDLKARSQEPEVRIEGLNHLGS
jgi:hypothetical protein